MFALVLCTSIMGCVIFLNATIDRLLPTVLLLPFIGAVCICILPANATLLHKRVALFFTLITLIAAICLWASYVPQACVPFQHVFQLSAGWQGTVWVRLDFGVDALSLWMVLLTAFLMPLAVLCSWQTQQPHSYAFMALLLVLETALFGAFTCLDLLGFYVLYESALLPMFLLIGLGGSRSRKIRAAYLLVLYTLIGSLAMLPAVLLMYSIVGSTSFELLLHTGFAPARQYVLWWGLFLAFAVKVPIMPVHLWLPEAHVEASTAGSLLLAGVLLKLGTYGLLRFNLTLLPEASIYYTPFVIVLCLLGIVYASLTTLRQVDLKKVVAYSSIAHMNLVVLSVFTTSHLGATAACFQILAHGVASPALFVLVGALYDRTHTKALKYLGGAATAMPLFSILFLIFSLSNMALPLTANFVGEFLCLCSIYGLNLYALRCALIGVLLRAAYSLWTYARVVHGMPKPYVFQAIADLNRREFWILVPLLLLNLWWGLKPSLLLCLLSHSLSFWQQTTTVEIPYLWVIETMANSNNITQTGVEA